MSENNIKVPTPADPDDVFDQFKAFVDIVKLLRTECPWDREQTHQSISRLLIEEAYEALDAIQENDDAEFAKELGDILLHIVMHSVMAEERNAFSLIDVIKKISHKMVSRHPHVFGNTSVTDQDDVLNNWENIKMAEGRKSALEGVPNNMPALLRAERIQEKASRVGFDWSDKADVVAKMDEEYNEFKVELLAADKEKAFEEFGDLLFAITNLARFEDIAPEDALQAANKKFTRRFQFVEAQAAASGRKLNEMTLAEMDEYWELAKKQGIK